MLLTIDIGNTNLEFGFFDDDKMIANFRLVTRHDITSDEFGLTLLQFMSVNNISKGSIVDIAISSVVPQIMYSVTNGCKKYLGMTPLIAGDSLEIDMPVLYDNPSEIGTDRLVSATAAYIKYGGPLIIVDFGTATTFNAVDREGRYLGGAIMPGIKISMEALFERTAKLPRIELAKPDAIIGKNTSSAMQSGFYYGYSGAVSNFSKLMKKVLGEDTKVVVTGGLSSMFSNDMTEIDYIDKELTIYGLKYLYTRHIHNI